MPLSAGQYKGRIGARVYDTSGALGAARRTVAHDGIFPSSNPVHDYMTPQRAQQLKRQAIRDRNALRVPSMGDGQFLHETQALERQSDMVVLGRTKVQSSFSGNTYERKMYVMRMRHRFPVTVHAIPHETQSLVLAGVTATIAGLCLGALCL